MRFRSKILVLALASAVSLAAVGLEQARGRDGKSQVSVGAFAVLLTRSHGSQPSLDANRAVASLVKAGVPLGDPQAPLTERKLVEILDFYGIAAKAVNPAAAVNRGRAEAAALLIGSSDRGRSAPGVSVVPSPSTLDDCLAQSNHGQCVNCCKALGTTSAKRCSDFCHQINKGSSPEPIP
jgi:hypothetical protein